MPAPFSASSRFRLEIRTNAGVLVRQIQHRNLQAQWFLGAQGATLSFDTSFRETGLTFAEIYPGKNEIWLWDSRVTGYPIFQGPITAMTMNSTGGTLNISCSDYLWYFQKKIMSTTTAYNAVPESVMSALLTYVETTSGVYTSGVTVSVDSHSSPTSKALSVIQSSDLTPIADLWDQFSQMGDGVDYYMRGDGSPVGEPILHLWGGRKKPAALPLAMQYPGGALAGYSYQIQAAGLANTVFIVGDGSAATNFGVAISAAKLAEYNYLYEIAQSAAQNDNASLNKQAGTLLKATQSALQIPTLTVRSEYFSPFVDFDLGDQFAVRIDDELAQYNGLIRVVGFQSTYGPNDSVTTNIYTNDTEEVT